MIGAMSFGRASRRIALRDETHRRVRCFFSSHFLRLLATSNNHTVTSTDFFPLRSEYRHNAGSSTRPSSPASSIASRAAQSIPNSSDSIVPLGIVHVTPPRTVTRQNSTSPLRRRNGNAAAWCRSTCDRLFPRLGFVRTML